MAPLHRKQNRPAPLAAYAHALHEPQGGQQDGAPDPDRRVARDEADGEGRQPHEQQSGDESGLAPDAVAVMAEDRGAYRAGHEAHGIDEEDVEGGYGRVALGEEQLGEDQAGRGAVEEEVIPLDRRADSAGDDRAGQLAALVAGGGGRLRHGGSPLSRWIPDDRCPNGLAHTSFPGTPPAAFPSRGNCAPSGPRPVNSGASTRRPGGQRRVSRGRVWTIPARTECRAPPPAARSGRLAPGRPR